MKFVFTLVFLFASTGFAQSVNFRDGNRFEVITADGWASLNCAIYGMGMRTISCSEDLISPDVFGVVKSDTSIDADHVTLVATHESGKQTTKTASYDSKSGESDRVNLLISTLFQKPLLNLGHNSIAYTFTKNSKPVVTGTFESTVTIVEQRRCRNRFVTGTSPTMCQNESFACDEYFREERDCKY